MDTGPDGHPDQSQAYKISVLILYLNLNLDFQKRDLYY